MGRDPILFSSNPRDPSGGSGQFPGAFDDQPIPLDDPQPVGPKVPNHLRPREPEPVPPRIGISTPSGPEPASKIRAFEQKLSGRHEDKGWNRTPNSPGTGAIHVKSFHCKLNAESLEFLDQQVNEWLDAHPQYEVKMVTSSVGDWTGKTREPNLVLQVWV